MFIYKGIEGDQARVGVVISDHEVHDFLMTEDQLNGNIETFGSESALEQAQSALSASLADVG